jgi:hypothetical protein
VIDGGVSSILMRCRIPMLATSVVTKVLRDPLGQFDCGYYLLHYIHRRCIYVMIGVEAVVCDVT